MPRTVAEWEGRREFSARTKAAAVRRADGHCEYVRSGIRCGWELHGAPIFRGVDPCWVAGYSLSNCQVICERCDAEGPSAPILNRCVFIEGIGRVHVIGNSYYSETAAMDASSLRDEATLGMQAADVVAGLMPGRILWAVRFKEKHP